MEVRRPTIEAAEDLTDSQLRERWGRYTNYRGEQLMVCSLCHRQVALGQFSHDLDPCKGFGCGDLAEKVLAKRRAERGKLMMAGQGKLFILAGMLGLSVACGGGVRVASDCFTQPHTYERSEDDPFKFVCTPLDADSPCEPKKADEACREGFAERNDLTCCPEHPEVR